MLPQQPPWAHLTAEEHEIEYNPQRAFPDFARCREARMPANEAALQALERRPDLAYGDHPRRRLDVYPAGRAGARAPVHLFLHGGYWRAQDKDSFPFVAGALVPYGVTTVIASYELCPGSTLDGVVDSALAAFRWTARNIADHGGDPAMITISGHSAGAHLCAEILAHDWSAEGLSRDVVKGATLISGIFDPTPAMLTTVNAEIQLTAEIAARRNVEVRPPHLKCPVALVAGAREPAHWVDQSFRYYQHLRQHGFSPTLHVTPRMGHFDIIDGFMLPESDLFRAVRSHLAPLTAPTVATA